MQRCLASPLEVLQPCVTSRKNSNCAATPQLRQKRIFPFVCGGCQCSSFGTIPLKLVYCRTPSLAHFIIGILAHFVLSYTRCKKLFASCSHSKHYCEMLARMALPLMWDYCLKVGARTDNTAVRASHFTGHARRDRISSSDETIDYCPFITCFSDGYTPLRLVAGA